MPKLYGGERRGSRIEILREKFVAPSVVAEREMRHDAGRKGKITHAITPYAQDSPAAAVIGASACICMGHSTDSARITPCQKGISPALGVSASYDRPSAARQSRGQRVSCARK